jgi:hypothetical protein
VLICNTVPKLRYWRRGLNAGEEVEEGAIIFYTYSEYDYS